MQIGTGRHLDMIGMDRVIDHLGLPALRRREWTRPKIKSVWKILETGAYPRYLLTGQCCPGSLALPRRLRGKASAVNDKLRIPKNGTKASLAGASMFGSHRGSSRLWARLESRSDIFNIIICQRRGCDSIIDEPLGQHMYLTAVRAAGPW
jgi:hypothetical protein